MILKTTGAFYAGKEVIVLNGEKEYLIDIASESRYTGQNKEYHDAFRQWRTKEGNRYGYKYVKDTREHTYAFGEGFETELASDSERDSLKYSSCAIGGVMLISAVIRLLQVLFDSRSGHMLKGSSIELYGNTHPSDILSTVILSLFKPFSLLICILLIWMFTRLPKKVFMPKGRRIPARHTFCLFGVVAGIAVTCYILSVFFRIFFGAKFMSVPGGFVWCDDIGLNIHCFGTQYIITPILHAILMNGLILQLLRQFGDSTAIIITATTEAIMAINLTNIGTHFVLSLAVCIVTLKTGSIFKAIFVRIMINVIFFGLKMIDTSYPSGESELYMLLACILIMAIGLACLGKLISYDDFEMNIKSSDTQLNFRNKMQVFFTAMPTISWLAASLIAWLYIAVS